MSDAVSVLGSRHGVLFDPIHHECHLLRFDRFTRMPRFQLRIGAVINGEEIVLPLCQQGTRFNFLDQRTSPCTTSLIGIHAASALRVECRITTPFRPRDMAFSTVPVITFEISVQRLPGIFRWTTRDKSKDAAEVEVFCELLPHADWQLTEQGNALDIAWSSTRAEVKEGFKDV